MLRYLATGAACLAVAACQTVYSVTPVDTGTAKVTYNSGNPTTDLELTRGAVKLTPLGVSEKGRVSFAVAAFNKAEQSQNFGTENFHASVANTPVKVFSHAQLVKEAKNEAAWAAVAVALSGAAAAYSAQQNAYSTTNAQMYTPRGTYTYTAQTYNPTAAAIGTAAAGAATGAGLYAINRELDSTIDRLGGTILQTTTIDPNGAFGGQVIVAKPKVSPPYQIEVTARWNDEDYIFRFNVAPVK